MPAAVLSHAARPASAPPPLLWRGARSVSLVAAVAVLLRVPGLGRPPDPDEAGFLVVGRQWGGAGRSLYRDYWVDRPPLLMTVFRVAAQLGGLVPLRLIGCLATALVVLGVARLAGQLAGPRAALPAAVVAAALCVSPLLGGGEVDGELLAAPFVAWGAVAVLRALDPARDGRGHGSLRAAAAAGAAAVAAVLVKQNFLDVAVFGVVTLGLAVRSGAVSRGHAGRVLLAASGGAAGCLGLAAAWTVWHGTSVTGVLDAMYPFRLQAAHAMAASTDGGPAARLPTLLAAWAGSGLALLTALVCCSLLARRLHRPASWGLVVLLGYDSVSALAGGNSWLHYLLQLVVPVSALTGAMVARRQPGAGVAVAGVVVVALVAWAVGLPGSAGNEVGSAVGAASRPGDTLVVVYGHADVVWSSGLASPYPFLWSLPLKTLDPRLRVLDDVLRGPAAPTWFVRWGRFRTWGVHSGATARLVAERYHPVAGLAGTTVYLRDGVRRPVPVLSSVPTDSTRPRTG
jgi:hypothetical protein